MDELLKKRAEKVLDAVIDHYEGYWRDLGDIGLGPDYPQPKVIEDDDGGALVVWEEGPENWATLKDGGVDEVLLKGVLEVADLDIERAKRMAYRPPIKIPDDIEVEVGNVGYALRVR